jgi:hypothetical protein
MQKRTVKTKDQILEANKKKMLGKLKHVVADREELWLGFFELAVDKLLSDDSAENRARHQILIIDASLLADEMLSAYEKRWGN